MKQKVDHRPQKNGKTASKWLRSTIILVIVVFLLLLVFRFLKPRVEEVADGLFDTISTCEGMYPIPETDSAAIE